MHKKERKPPPIRVIKKGRDPTKALVVRSSQGAVRPYHPIGSPPWRAGGYQQLSPDKGNTFKMARKKNNYKHG